MASLSIELNVQLRATIVTVAGYMTLGDKFIISKFAKWTNQFDVKIVIWQVNIIQ